MAIQPPAAEGGNADHRIRSRSQAKLRNGPFVVQGWKLGKDSSSKSDMHMLMCGQPQHPKALSGGDGAALPGLRKQVALRMGAGAMGSS
jgi:hypothetical protein